MELESALSSCHACIRIRSGGSTRGVFATIPMRTNAHSHMGAFVLSVSDLRRWWWRHKRTWRSGAAIDQLEKWPLGGLQRATSPRKWSRPDCVDATRYGTMPLASKRIPFLLASDEVILDHIAIHSTDGILHSAPLYTRLCFHLLCIVLLVE
mmetsp:Transcript_15059/g.41686  ORF Transcript_15059/g.41686 Transcript_15059/m.41686 type:complete len:152 (-) Transcript_15059:1256-1711(-)